MAVSLPIGKVRPNSPANSPMDSLVSVGSQETAMISTRSEYALYASSINGNSFLHGPHQLAQMLINTSSFSLSVSYKEIVFPSYVSMVKSNI